MLILRWKKKSNPSVGKELNLLNSSHCISLLKPTIATKTIKSISEGNTPKCYVVDLIFFLVIFLYLFVVYSEYVSPCCL